MGKKSTKFVYVKTCSKCLHSYWTTAKRTPGGLCNKCCETSGKKIRRPVGNLTDEQVDKYLTKMRKNCIKRMKNDKT